MSYRQIIFLRRHLEAVCNIGWISKIAAIRNISAAREGVCKISTKDSDYNSFVIDLIRNHERTKVHFYVPQEVALNGFGPWLGHTEDC